MPDPLPLDRLTPDEILRIRGDFAAVDAGKRRFVSYVWPFVQKRWPHAVTAIVTALGTLGIAWGTGYVTPQAQPAPAAPTVQQPDVEKVVAGVLNAIRKPVEKP